jgi:hypothetical protein
VIVHLVSESRRSPEFGMPGRGAPTGRAELASVVEDRWQARGCGPIPIRLLIEAPVADLAIAEATQPVTPTAEPEDSQRSLPGARGRGMLPSVALLRS